MSTLISRREPCVGSSRMMTPFDAFALKVMPWASERAWRSVVPSFKVNEPGDLTSPVTKKTSARGDVDYVSRLHPLIELSFIERAELTSINS